MAVRLAQLPTLRDLYAKAVLKAPTPKTARFAANLHLLDRVSLWQGDITKLEVDAIVNAANRSLLGGGGVDGAIHSAAGRQLLEECRTLGGCDTGNSKITEAYNLPSKYVIHTVGPVYSPSEVERKAKQLASCYRTSLELAVRESLKHVAFCSVSTGIYGYPIEDATHIALQEVRSFLDGVSAEQLERVVFVVWSDKDKSVYEHLIPGYFPPEEAKPDDNSPSSAS